MYMLISLDSFWVLIGLNIKFFRFIRKEKYFFIVLRVWEINLFILELILIGRFLVGIF